MYILVVSSSIYPDLAVDKLNARFYNKKMQKTNEIIQWLGAGLIILGHMFNSIGPSTYPWNIVVFSLGALMFLIWSIRVSNKPQFAVNAVSLTIIFIGLYKAFS